MGFSPQPAPVFRFVFRRLALAFLACLMLSLLAGCPGKHVDDGARQPYTGPKGTKPYTIGGKTYRPLLSAHGYREEGIASWYGKDFHGKKTANGERYDMYAMTAAHKLLPFGTRLQVTNLSSNQSIIVRVNDRGPFVGDRIIDLTYTGAQQLGMIGPGTARVRIESIGAVKGLKDGDIAGKFFVQVGAFAQKSNAHNLAVKIQRSSRSARVVHAPAINFWRVQIGPYPGLVAAQNAADGLKSEYPGNFVVAE